MCEVCGWEGELLQVEDALEEIDGLPDTADEFASSVREKLESMHDWIGTNNHVTSAQSVAISNMRGGIRRWLERE